jgi:hypothetical protein
MTGGISKVLSYKAVIAMAAVVVIITLIVCLPTKARRAVTALVVDGPCLWLGEVWEDPALVWTLPIRNTTNEDVVISGFATSCSCGRVEPSSLTVSAHGVAEVRLTLNLVTRAESEPPARDFTVTISPQVVKGPGPQPAWVLRGKVRRAFTIDPPLVDFGDTLVRDQPFAARAVSVICGLDVTELTASCDSPFIVSKVTRNGSAPHRFTVHVQAGSDIPEGVFNHPVRLKGVTANKETVTGLVSVVGCVVEDVNLLPDVVAFGAAPSGSRLTETVALRSRSGQPIAIQGIDTGSVPGISVGVNQEKDGSASLAVSVVINWLGFRQYIVRAKVETRQGLRDLSLPVSCYGIASAKEEKP